MTGGFRNGYYQARMVDPVSEVVMASWSSIPLNGGARHTVTLQAGQPARVERANVTGSFALDQNVPNPFNPETTIRYRLAEPGNVRMTIYNSLGQAVRTLVDGYQPSGDRIVRWNSQDDQGRSVS
jgi:flagellar hook assembly protein FlgD